MENVVNLYSVRDIAAGQYGPLFEAVNDQVAARNFYGIMKKVPAEFQKEYELHRLGTINTKTGEIQGDFHKNVMVNFKIMKEEVGDE